MVILKKDEKWDDVKSQCVDANVGHEFFDAKYGTKDLEHQVVFIDGKGLKIAGCTDHIVKGTDTSSMGPYYVRDDGELEPLA